MKARHPVVSVTLEVRVALLQEGGHGLDGVLRAEVHGLRHPFIVEGMRGHAYGKPLPNSMGAPLRLHLPWKYGFKSIKGIVKVALAYDWSQYAVAEEKGNVSLWSLGVQKDF